ncbi:hypothetical protein HMPREF9442_01849 [Paraprevotella xylaniphila YIT 11841]|uniref:Uncharacterized protein n=1 Tax=Paraprevotella xylaniphila YIT 11841 TaxID=762982 RepID=F3QUH8_9BACT|nr:hypothetical protein HMPREF9442_01849 [Paraprevotella xylaniphila YIT 11841]
MYPPNPVGGAFLPNRESYIRSGLENEKFYGWGWKMGNVLHGGKKRRCLYLWHRRF